MATLLAPSPDVAIASFQTTADDGATIELRWYTKRDTAPGSAVVYAHGGGMVLGTRLVEVRQRVVAQVDQLALVIAFARRDVEHPAGDPLAVRARLEHRGLRVLPHPQLDQSGAAASSAMNENRDASHTTRPPSPLGRPSSRARWLPCASGWIRLRSDPRLFTSISLRRTR
jgi:hypothetical protein